MFHYHELYAWDNGKIIDAENNIGKMYSGKVSPTIADDIKRSSVWAILGSLIVVFLYILLRFKKWQFSEGPEPIQEPKMLHDMYN